MRAARAMRSGGRIFIPRPLPHAGAGLELVEGDLGGNAGSSQCLGGAAAMYNGRGGAVVLLGAEGGQDLSRSARNFWLFCAIVLNFQNNTPVLRGWIIRAVASFRQELRATVRLFSAYDCVDVRKSN